VLGIASAYFGGRIDDWIQRFVDILLAFPIIVLAGGSRGAAQVRYR